MALVLRKRINSTLKGDNFNFIVELSNKTKLNQSKFYDLAVELLKRELENKNLDELFKEFEEIE